MWNSVESKLPELARSDCYDAESKPVLCVLGKFSGYQAVCQLTQWDDSEPQWKTCDSEGWNVTDSVTHWMDLPEMPK